MRGLIRSFASDERGATAIEYALIAMGVAVAVVASVYAIGPTLNAKYVAVNSQIK